MDAMHSTPKVPSRVGKHYLVKGHIESGAFGDLFKGTDTRDGTQVAIKLESLSCNPPQLAYAIQAYQHVQGKTGFARILDHGQAAGTHRYMVMEMLGQGLHKLQMGKCRGRMSLGTVLQLADQALCRLETLHEAGYLHRDIKCANLLMGGGNSFRNKATLYLIDFGLVKPWRVNSNFRETGEDEEGRRMTMGPERLEDGSYHIPMRTDKGTAGTPMFMSVNAHNGYTQSRRDDLECLAYVFIYLLAGTLPWDESRYHGRKVEEEELPEGFAYEDDMDDMERRMLLTQAKKETTDAQALVKIAGLTGAAADAFGYWVDHARNLEFTAKPKYAKIRKRLHKAAAAAGVKYNGMYDWTKGGR